MEAAEAGPGGSACPWAAILLTVAVAFPATKSLPGTYSMANQPGIDPSRYNKPANLSGFFIKLARVVIEGGTHSAWVQDIIAGKEHEVLVANPRHQFEASAQEVRNSHFGDSAQ